MNYLKELGFEDKVIELINKNIPSQALENLTTEEATVTQNIKYLKDLGISNYVDAFIKFYNMFLLDNDTFDNIDKKGSHCLGEERAGAIRKIEGIKIKNYKFIKELEIEQMENACILIGRNSTGKTMILDAIMTAFGLKECREKDFNELDNNIEITVKLPSL